MHCHVPKTDWINLREKYWFQSNRIYIIKTSTEAFGLLSGTKKTQVRTEDTKANTNSVQTFSR